MARKRYIVLDRKTRRVRDTKTGIEYSRRAFDKIRAAKGQIKRKSSVAVSIQRRKTKIYNDLLTSYIEKERQKGRKPTRKKARESERFKQIIRDLKSEDPKRKLRALKKTTRRDGIPDDVPLGDSP